PYHGQHGYMTEIWPIPTHLYGDPTALRDQGLIGDEHEEFTASYGRRLAALRSQVQRYSRKVWLQLAVTLLVFTILFVLYGQISIVISVVVGIVSNLITTIGWNLISDRVAAK